MQETGTPWAPRIGDYVPAVPPAPPVRTYSLEDLSPSPQP